MRTVTRIISAFLACIMLFFAAPIGQVLGLDTSELALEAVAAETASEYALFPMDVLNIVRTNTKLDADQKKKADPTGGHVHYAWDFSGSDTTVVAPFTGKVIYVDKGGAHSVILESTSKVKLADGTENYLVCMFTHDDAINSNVKVGQIIQQGEYFYDQGTYGKGNKGTYERHLHLEVAVGQPSANDKNSFSNLLKYIRGKSGRQADKVFHLKSNTTRNKDYIKVVCQNNKIINFNWKTVSKITFNASGGAVTPASQYFTVDGTYGSLPTPKRTYYSFIGWYTASTGGTKVADTAKVTKGDKTYYARWKVAHTSTTYALAYNSNGGTGTMETDVAVKDKKFTLSANAFIKKGYVFSGWTVKRKSDGKWYVAGKGWKTDAQIKLFKYTKKVYSNNASMTFSTSWYKASAKNDTYTFYAVWKACKSHTWDAGKVTTAATTVKEGVKTFTCTACKQTKTQAIAKPTTDSYFSKVSSSNITATNAKITGTFKKTTKIKTAGFYIGTNKNSLKKITKNLNGKADGAGSFSSVYYTMSDWYGALKPNTTYYYALYYVDSNGKECVSVIKSFKTAAQATATWSKYAAKSITKTNAVISATVTFNKTATQEKCGFYIGTSTSNLKKATKYDTINKTRALTNMSYDLTKYGQTLKANTTYYYQFYVVADGKEYKSDVKSFKTSK